MKKYLHAGDRSGLEEPLKSMARAAGIPLTNESPLEVHAEGSPIDREPSGPRSDEIWKIVWRQQAQQNIAKKCRGKKQFISVLEKTSLLTGRKKYKINKSLTDDSCIAENRFSDPQATTNFQNSETPSGEIKY